LPDTTKGWPETLGCDAEVADGNGTDVNLSIYLCGISPFASASTAFRSQRL